jgi:hypothetical protein
MVGCHSRMRCAQLLLTDFFVSFLALYKGIKLAGHKSRLYGLLLRNYFKDYSAPKSFVERIVASIRNRFSFASHQSDRSAI